MKQGMQLYSGYFKHTIERQLLNSESIFILLGYEQHDNLLFLDGPVDPDHVTRVALDCLTAYVECQIMIQICEKITNYKCTWEEIHQVREDYVCRIDEAVRILQQLKRAAQEEEKIIAEKDQIKESPEEYPMPANSILRNSPRTGVLVDLSNTWPNSARLENIPPSPPSQFDSAPYTTKSNVRTAVSHSRSPSWSEGVSSQLDRQQQTRRRVARPDGVDDMWTESAASNWSSHHRHADMPTDGLDDSWDLYMSIPRPSFQDSYNSYVDFDRNGYRMNYGQLPHVKNMYNSPYVTNFNPHFHPHTNYPFMPHPDIFMNTTRQCRCHMCCEQPAMFPHREIIGGLDGRDRYGGIERPDVSPYVTRAFHQLSLDGYSQLPKSWHTSADGIQKPEIHKTIDTVSSDDNLVSPTVNNRRNHQTTKRASFYDNIGQEPELLSADVPSKREENVSSYPHAKVISQKNGLEKTSNLKNPANKAASTIELSHNNEVANSCTSKSNFPRRDSDIHKWSCSFCTYFNLPDKKICEICGRSRFMGAESMPLVSGGRECPQCTLVNEKDAKDCTACGTSLKDSPTYI